MRRLFSVGYFASWLLTAALLSFILTALLWGIAGVSSLTGVDDDAALLALPVGALLGAWAAVRTRRAPVIHRVCAVLGICFTLTGMFTANRFMQRSEQASGTGPFAGLGELVVVGMSIGVVALGACMFGIWAFARLAGVGDVEP